MPPQTTAQRRFAADYAEALRPLVAAVGGDERAASYAAIVAARLMALHMIAPARAIGLRQAITSGAVSGTGAALTRHELFGSDDAPFAQHTLDAAYGERLGDGTPLLPLLGLCAAQSWSLVGEPGVFGPDALALAAIPPASRKRHGVYHTAPDIGGYLARATLLPLLLGRLLARYDCAEALDALLRRDPERYLFAALRHGCELPLPPEIAAGLAQTGDRAGWQARATPQYALPGETWREVIARRDRADAARQRLLGERLTPDDLVTWNVDAAMLLADLVAQHADDELALALLAALDSVAVLDPTCGAGALLLAAHAAIAPLYVACLARLGRNDAVCAGAALALGRLYGCDLLPEAAEVCRLRLWLLAGAGAPGAATIVNGDVLHRELWLGRAAFGAVVANPPYVRYSAASADAAWAGYRTLPGGNLYALVVERGLGLLEEDGRLGAIVPAASVATGGMAELRALYRDYGQWHSHYAVRPGKLFADVDMNLTISLLRRGGGAAYSSGYRRWSDGRVSDRSALFATLEYVAAPPAAPHLKLGSRREVALLERLLAHGRRLGDYAGSPGDPGDAIYYHSGGRYWRKALPERLSSHYRPLRVPAALAPVTMALLNSQLFYWYWIATSNCMDVVASDVRGLPVFDLALADGARYAGLVDALLAAYAAGRRVRRRDGARIVGDEVQFDLRRARPAIDAIDRALAADYGLDAEQLDGVLHYDLKYRMGRGYY